MFLFGGALLTSAKESAAPVGLLFFLVLSAGLISLIHPLRAIYIHDRNIAARVVLASLLGLFIFRGMGGPSSAPPRQAVATAVRTPVFSDGCDTVSDPIPNCKEEVARMTAAQAALPPLRQTSDRPHSSDPGSDWAKQVLQTVQKADNETKAEEASANYRALAAKRELERADADESAAQQNLSNSTREMEDEWKRGQADVDRANYNLNVQERHLETLEQQRLDNLDQKATEARHNAYGYNNQ